MKINPVSLNDFSLPRNISGKLKKTVASSMLCLSLFCIPVMAQNNMQVLLSTDQNSLDLANVILTTSDNHYMIFGITYDPSSTDKLFITKLDNSGNAVSSKVLDIGNNDECTAAIATNDGKYVLLCNTIMPGSGDNVIALIKTDNTGTVDWIKTIAYSGTMLGYNVRECNDGGYIITGMFYSPVTDNDLLLIKTDGTGNISWTKTYDALGGDIGYDVQQTTDGGYIAVGSSYLFSSSNQNDEVSVLKLDGSGNIQWSRVFAGVAFPQNATAVSEGDNNDYYVAGFAYEKTFLLNLSDTGNINWLKMYSTGGASTSAAGIKMHETYDPGFILSSGTWNGPGGSSDGYLIKVNAGGNTTWSRAFGGAGSEGTGSVANTNIDNGYVVLGASSSFSSSDLFIFELDSNGHSSRCHQNAIITTTDSTSVFTSSVHSFNVVTQALTATSYTAAAVPSGVIITDPCTTGISSYDEKNNYSLFPNPSDGKFFLSGIEEKSIIEIFDMLGRSVYKKQCDGSLQLIELEIKGLYTYILYLKNGMPQTGKLIVK
jgi:hypothetical protein